MAHISRYIGLITSAAFAMCSAVSETFSTALEYAVSFAARAFTEFVSLTASATLLLDRAVHALALVLAPRLYRFKAFVERLLTHERYQPATGFSEMRSTI